MTEDHGWLFLPADAVPTRWRERAVELALIPLLPEELGEILARREPLPQLTVQEEKIAKLVAQSAPVKTIAKELGISRRSAERLLASLRDQFGVRSTAELAVFLAKRGF